MEEKDIIAANIVFFRKRMGLSQLELAEKLQYSNKNISKWEKGETTPSIFTLKRLAEIFGITVDELISVDASALPPETAAESAKTRSPLKIKFTWLLFANAILLIITFIAIYVLAMCEVTRFNKWLLLAYVSPLMALSVLIFIRCVFKFVDFISMSLMNWLTALSVFLTAPRVHNIGYIFLLALAVQILIISVVLLVNFRLVEKIKSRFKNKKR